MTSIARLGPALLLVLAGCDPGRFTAQQSMGLLTRGSQALQEHWDVDLVGDGMPGAILQLEGLYATLPDDSRVGLELLRAYVAYGYGWILDEAEQSQLDGETDKEEQLFERAEMLFLRARNTGLHHIRLSDPSFDASVEAGGDALRAHLRSRFTSRDDAELLLLTGHAWGLAILASNGDPERVLELDTARALVERAIDLDETAVHYGGVIFLGALESMPGGNPERSREMFEHALEGTHRQFFPVQVQYAQTYALNNGDRELFVRLLREVIDGGDPVPETRLVNRLARRRAIRWLRRTDELF